MDNALPFKKENKRESLEISIGWIFSLLSLQIPFYALPSSAEFEQPPVRGIAPLRMARLTPADVRARGWVSWLL